MSDSCKYTLDGEVLTDEQIDALDEQDRVRVEFTDSLGNVSRPFRFASLQAPVFDGDDVGI